MSVSIEDNMPRFACRDGALNIGTRLVEMRVCWAPEPLAEELTLVTGKWQPFWPEFRLVRPVETRPALDGIAPDALVDASADMADVARVAAFTAFRAQIPPEVAQPAEPFGSHQWLLMLLLRLKEEARDLAANNPVLAYCLANNPGFRNTLQQTAPWHAAVHCANRQREILEWLGFPSKEATVRLFRRIRPEAASPFMMRMLRSALKEDERVMDLLAHQPCINAGVLGLVTNSYLRAIVTPKLLLEVAANPDDLALARTPDRLLTGMALLRESGCRLPPTPLIALSQVRSLQEQCDKAFREHLARKQEQQERERQVQARERQVQVREAAERRQRRAEQCTERREALAAQAERRARRILQQAQRPFPPPPLPGTQEIEPLTSAAALLAEGAEQHNCVGGYTSLVLTGRIYVYRVLHPDRATLSIRLGPDGSWRRSELAAKGNTPAPPAVVRRVDQWLQGHRISV